MHTLEIRPTNSPTPLLTLRIRMRLALLTAAAGVLLTAYVYGVQVIPGDFGPKQTGMIGLGLMALVGLGQGSILLRAGNLTSRSTRRLVLASTPEILTGASLFLQVATGFLAQRVDAGSACAGWPLCGASLWPADPLARVEIMHRIAAGVGLAAAAWLGLETWRARRRRPDAFAAGVVALTFYAIEILLGLLISQEGSTRTLSVLHLLTAVAMWGAVVMTLALRARAVGPTGAAVGNLRSSTWRDYLALTKPAIVALLLVTTLAGVIVGAGGWPGASVVAWTLLGGALSAGGASALNQYVDRDLDRRMQRTERRPLPNGRISATEALAFGLVLCIAGFYVLALAVNLLSALLALAGMVYYAVLYSLVLKTSTPQNIVVGGGAGAIPPLVGWAAARGNLAIGALFLFALVFFWTPPHFWALALVRRKDYARAGVPMLPVVQGEHETALQILLYTVQLVALSLLLPVAGDGGLLTLIAVAVLGVGFVAQAWRLWRRGGNKAAWGLYKYSSSYLALVFLVLVVDTLLRA